MRVHQIEIDLQNEELRDAYIALEQSRDRFSELYDFAPVGYLTLTDKGLIQEINYTGSRLLGLERGLLIDRALSRFVHQDDQSAHYMYLSRLFRSGTRQVIDLHMKTKEGVPFHARLEGTAVTDSDGTCTSSRIVVSDITALKTAEEELQRSKDNLEAILNATTESVLLLDPKGRILEVNRAAADGLGCGRDELTGRSVYGFLEPEERASGGERLAAVTAGGKPLRFEEDLGGKSYQHNIYPVVEADGRVDRIAVFAKNVTEQKRAEKELRENEERLRAVFESATECIFIMDEDLRYTHVNPAVSGLFGISESRIIGRTSEDLFGEEIGRQISAINFRVLAGERIEHEQVRIVGHTPIRFHDIRVPLRDSENRTVGLCCLSRFKPEDSLRDVRTGSTPVEYPSSTWQDTLKLARSAARSKSIVLLLGESGSGKDYLARWIHDHSPYASGPFVSVNCAALPRELAESELFGHERGSFTGAAVRKKGQLEFAEGGTILLNEIGELDLSVQAKLLAFMDTSTFLRVGGETQIRVGSRLIAATHRDLDKEVSQGRFLGPLFYRLSVFPINVPPLRERLEDLPLLVEEVLARVASEMQLKKLPIIHDDQLSELSRYHWPGNVRELRNVMERSLMLWRGGRFDLVMAGIRERAGDPGIHVRYAAGTSLRDAHLEVTKYFCQEALRHCKGKKTEAAQLLGISRDAFYRYLKKLGTVS